MRDKPGAQVSSRQFYFMFAKSPLRIIGSGASVSEKVRCDSDRCFKVPIAILIVYLEFSEIRLL